MKLSERIRELRHSLGCQEGDYSPDYAEELADEVAQLEAYCDKLAEGLPEGMLPKDIEILRKANHDFAEENAALKRLRDYVERRWKESPEAEKAEGYTILKNADIVPLLTVEEEDDE